MATKRPITPILAMMLALWSTLGPVGCKLGPGQVPATAKPSAKTVDTPPSPSAPSPTPTASATPAKVPVASPSAKPPPSPSPTPAPTTKPPASPTPTPTPWPVPDSTASPETLVRYYLGTMKPEVLSLYFDKDKARVMGIPGGSGVAWIWAKSAAEAVADYGTPGSSEQIVGSLDADYLDDALCTVRVKHATADGRIYYRSAFVFTHEDGIWRIVAYTCESRAFDGPGAPLLSESPDTPVRNYLELANSTKASLFLNKGSIASIAGGEGTYKIWQYPAGSAIALYPNTDPGTFVIDSLGVAYMDTALAVVSVRYHSLDGSEHKRAAFVLSSEPGSWKIASLVYETRKQP